MELEQSWAVYVERGNGCRRTSKEAWLQSLMKVAEFNRASDFWCWYRNTAALVELPSNIISLRMFRSNRSLEQLDDDNISGGRILFSLTENQSIVWLKLLLIVLSNSSTEIFNWAAGVAVKRNASKGHRFEVWLQSGVRTDSIQRIILFICLALKIDDQSIVQFRPHSSA